LKDPGEQDKLMKWILQLEFDHFSIPRPDLNIFLDVPFAFTEKQLTSDRTGENRTYLNGTRDIHEESLDFQRQVRDIYIRVSQSDSSLALINCGSQGNTMLPPENIFRRLTGILKERNFI
jgi:dTMP kinase